MREREHLTVDDARLLPRVRTSATLLDRHRLERAQAAALEEAMRDEPTGKPLPGAAVTAAPGDLRGIPVQAEGVGGVSPGTSPGSDAHLASLDRQRERRRRVVIEDRASEPMVGFA